MLLQDKYPIERNLDGIYFRVERNGKFVTRCFSDLTDDEQTEIINRFDEKALRRLCKLLVGILRNIGNQMDIFGMG